jgi:gliding motility-associated-like protein
MKSFQLFLLCLFVIIQSAASQNCEVKSSFTPYRDTTMFPSLLTLRSTSTGATTYKWIIDVYTTATGPTLSYYFSDVGVHTVRLIAMNGACADTSAEVKIICKGTAAPGEVFKSYYGKENFYSKPQKVIATSDSGFLMIGEQTFNDYYSNRDDIYLVKINAAGCVLWSKYIYADKTEYNNGNKENVISIKETKDHGLILLGFVSTASDSSFQFLMKLDKAGNTTWTRTFDANVIIQQSFADIIETPDGYVLSGQTTELQTGAALLQIDFNGKQLWNKVFRRAEQEYFYRIVYKEGFIYGCGATRRHTTDVYDLTYYGFVTKIDAKTGTPVWNKMFKGNDNFFPFDIHSYGNNILLSYLNGGPGYCVIDNGGNVVASRSIAVDLPISVYQYRIVPLPNNDMQVFVQGIQSVSLQPYQVEHSAFIKISANHEVLWAKSLIRSKFYDIGVAPDNSVGAIGEGIGQLASAHGFHTIYQFLKFDGSGNTITCNIFKPNPAARGDGFSVDNFSWTSQESDSLYTKDATLHNDKVYTSHRYDCQPYFESCNDVLISGPDSICSLTKIYKIKVEKGIGCTTPLSLEYNRAEFDVIGVTDSVINVKLLKYGSFKFKVLLNASCILASDSLIITAIDKRTAGIKLGADLKICEGMQQTLKAAGIYDTYQWQDGSTDSTIIITAPGTYHVLATDRCGNEYRDTIDVTSSPSIPINAGPDMIKCNVDSVVLNAPSGFVEYSWKPAYNIQNASTSNATVFPTKDTAYLLTVKNAQGCVGYDTIKVKVNVSRPINLGDDTTLCNSDELQLTASPGFSTYEWNTGNASSAIVIKDSGVYTIWAEDNNKCVSNDTITISLTSTPVFSLGNDTTLCDTEALTLKTDVAGNYTWYNSSSENEQTINTAGLYWLRVNNKGCVFSDSITVTYKSLPVVDLGPDVILCETETKRLEVFAQNRAYLWQDGSTSPAYTINKAGLYYVKVNLNGCSASDSLVAKYKFKPAFNLGNDTMICLGQTISLDPKINNAGVVWQNNSNAATFLVSAPGLYSVRVTNECGSNKDEINIVAGTCILYMPTAFSPNNDRVNDVFRVKNPEFIKTFHMVIFNRWGQKMFETTNPRSGWDGRISGIEQQSGTFIWTIKLTDLQGKMQKANGTVVLLK